MITSSIRTTFLLALLNYCWSLAAAETCSEKYGQPADSDDWGYNTLNEAVAASDYGCVKELLDGGYDPNSRDSSYYTPLRKAAVRNLGAISTLLIRYGALPNYQTGPGDYAIMDAACYGATEAIKAFSNAGASMDVVEYKLITPYESACSCRNSPANCPKSKTQASLSDEPTIAVYFNHDFASTDGVLNDGTKDITANNRECHNKCANTSGCSVWTRIKRTASGGSKEGECWLRSYQPTATVCDHCDSGVMKCEVYDNTDYTTFPDLLGGPYYFSGKTKSDQDCCALCYGIQDCKSWTRIKEDTEHNKKGECWLRSGYSQGHHNKATASGQIKKNDKQ